MLHIQLNIPHFLHFFLFFFFLNSSTPLFLFPTFSSYFPPFFILFSPLFVCFFFVPLLFFIQFSMSFLLYSTDFSYEFLLFFFFPFYYLLLCNYLIFYSSPFLFFLFSLIVSFFQFPFPLHSPYYFSVAAILHHKYNTKTVIQIIIIMAKPFNWLPSHTPNILEWLTFSSFSIMHTHVIKNCWNKISR